MRLPLRVPNKHLIVVGGNHAFAGYVGIYRNAADQWRWLQRSQLSHTIFRLELQPAKDHKLSHTFLTSMSQLKVNCKGRDVVFVTMAVRSHVLHTMTALNKLNCVSDSKTDFNVDLYMFFNMMRCRNYYYEWMQYTAYKEVRYNYQRCAKKKWEGPSTKTKTWGGTVSIVRWLSDEVFTKTKSGLKFLFPCKN